MAQRMKFFQRGKPLHARVKHKTCQFSFADLVGIYLGDSQSAKMDALHLACTFTLGVKRLRINGGDYVFAFKDIALKLEIGNGSIIPGTHYKHDLQKPMINSKLSINESRRSSNQNGATLAAEAGAGLAGFVSKISAGFRIGRDAECKRESDGYREIAERLALVQSTGQNTFQCGCDGCGDPRHRQGWLTGPIIDAQDDTGTATPLCIITADDQLQPVTILATAELEAESSCIFNDNCTAAEKLETDLKAINAETIKRRIIADRALREKVATMAAFKDVLRRQSPTNEVDINSRLIVATQTVIYHPYIMNSELDDVKTPTGNGIIR